MAYAVLHDKTRKELTREQGRALWDVLTGKNETPTKEQEAFALAVDKLYLNWRHAPDDYLIKHKELIAPVVKSSWMCDAQGRSTRPDPTDKDCIRVSRVLGLTGYVPQNYADPFPTSNR